MYSINFEGVLVFGRTLWILFNINDKTEWHFLFHIGEVVWVIGEKDVDIERKESNVVESSVGKDDGCFWTL